MATLRSQVEAWRAGASPAITSPLATGPAAAIRAAMSVRSTTPISQDDRGFRRASRSDGHRRLSRPHKTNRYSQSKQQFQIHLDLLSGVWCQVGLRRSISNPARATHISTSVKTPLAVSKEFATLNLQRLSTKRRLNSMYSRSWCIGLTFTWATTVDSLRLIHSKYLQLFILGGI
jgi:hypothetical protein